MGRIFGTDGVRDVANTALSCTLAMDIGRAAAMVVAQERGVKRPRFLLGCDTRISRHVLTNALCAGLCSVGADVVLLGVVPTPAVAYLVKSMRADGAIMVSASHNTYEFNGIKIFGSKGYKLTDEQENAIEAIVLDHAQPYSLKSHGELGTVTEAPEAVEGYIDHIVSTVEGDLSGMKIGVDCANGSASRTAATIFQRLGANVVLINDEPDGVNINHGCGSTHLLALQKLVVEERCDMGVAFDGDADRCLAVDRYGRLVDGDQMIAFFAWCKKQAGTLPENTAVVTVMSNMGFFRFAQEQGIHVEKTNVGDRYVLEQMLKYGYNIGGEQSGHIIFREYMTTGDGELTAVQLISMLKQQGKTLEEAAAMMTVYPQVLLNVKVNPKMKQQFQTDEEIWRQLRQLEEELGQDCRILLRPSGTEPLIRVMVEGKDKAVIEQAAAKMARIIEERLVK